MNLDEICDRCLYVLQKFLIQSGEFEDIKTGGGLFETTSLDSLTLVNLVVELENEFQIEIDAENIDDVFSTLGSLTAYIQSKVNG